MAYRSWHRDGGRPPPPPYSKHKHSAGCAAGLAGATAAATTTTFSGDSRYSVELFKDVSKKIAHLTKVVCSLTNKVEDQELTLRSARSEHEEKVRNIQSELHQKTEDYKHKIRVLEVQLQEERRRTLQKEEQLKTLKEFHAFVENCRLFREPLTRISKDKPSISGGGDSQDIGKLRVERGLGRNDSNLYFDSNFLFSSLKGLRNGSSEFTFIENRLRDMQSYENDFRALIDACEELKAEKMSLKTKYESDFHEREYESSQDLQGKEDKLFDLSSDGDKHLSGISPKEHLEKQDFQYRKRISDLLQCLTQSESRTEKYRKEIKRLEETLSSKDEQNSSMRTELSKTLEHLKQSRSANAEIQEVCDRQSAEIQAKNDLLAEIEDAKRNYEDQLTSSKLSTEQLSNKLKESHKETEHLQQLLKVKDADSKEFELLKIKLTTEQKKCEQLQKDFELRIKSIHKNHDEERRKLAERIQSLEGSFLDQERAFMQQMEDAKQRYEHHMDQERLVHREIQDNLEQQLDLLHRNVQHTIRDEEEQVATLHMLLEDKEISLNKTQKQLEEAREMSDWMRKLIKLKELELEKVREQQRIHHTTEVRFTVDNFPLSSHETEQQNKIHEFPVIFHRRQIEEEKHKFLKGRIEFLEEQNKFLRMEKEKLLKTHLMELEMQSQVHRKELEKLKGKLLENGEVLRKLIEERTGQKIPDEISRKGMLQDFSAGMEVESYREKCFDFQEAMRKIEEDPLSEKQNLRCELSARWDQVKKLTSLVETLQAEHGRVIVEREAKMNEVLRVRSEASQQIKNLESYWQERLVRELKKASHSFENEKQKLVSHFSKGQRLLKDKIALLQQSIIKKDMKDRKSKCESGEENIKAFQELRRTIVEKDATISKLKEQKNVLHNELLNKRDCSASASSMSHILASSMENIFALKKPRLERPPLTPQLVRRHFLLGSTEQKWLRARSQSPMRGFLPECTPASKSSLPTAPVHRSSWTGEISTDFDKSVPLKDDSDFDALRTIESSVPVKNQVYSTGNLFSNKEQALQIKSEQEKFPISQNSHESLSNHICDSIAECDELLMTLEDEEKQRTLELKEENLEIKDWEGNHIMESEI